MQQNNILLTFLILQLRVDDFSLSCKFSTEFFSGQENHVGITDAYMVSIQPPDHVGMHVFKWYK